MVQLLAFLAACLATGAALALVAIHAQMAVGWLGGILLVVWAALARWRWIRAEYERASDVSAPERVLWLRAAGLALIGGHLLTALLHPHLDLHLGQGNSLAIDSWYLALGLAIAAVVFRRDARITDERHDRIAARGIAGGYAALAVTVLALAFFLAFTPHQWRAEFDHFVLGNILIALLLFSYLAAVALQLALYRPSPRAGAAASRRS